MQFGAKASGCAVRGGRERRCSATIMRQVTRGFRLNHVCVTNLGCRIVRRERLDFVDVDSSPSDVA